jgi:hypothetical protein
MLTFLMELSSIIAAGYLNKDTGKVENYTILVPFRFAVLRCIVVVHPVPLKKIMIIFSEDNAF